ncbi:MAG: hypothetical protein D3906_09630, partial [Candidatus Electrothrix sp. AUS1_2]|nr:hypothetical protein [Candidatus Electrothrix sp. AUS1_2]
LLDANRFGLAVNYCAYAYKYRFQAKAARQRAVNQVVNPYEDVTDAGFIRSLLLKGDSQRLRHCVEILQAAGVEPTAYRLEREGRLFFKAALRYLLDCCDLELNVCYYRPQIKEDGSCRGSRIKVPLNRKRTLIVERVKIDRDRVISAEEQPLFHAAFLADNADPIVRSSREGSVAAPFADIFEYEQILPGLQPYF